MLAVVLPDWFAVNVPTLVQSFWIVSVQLFTVGNAELVMNPALFVKSPVSVGTVIFIVLFALAFAENVSIVLEFFWIVKIPAPISQLTSSNQSWSSWIVAYVLATVVLRLLTSCATV